MQSLAFHPWSELFPLLEGGAFDELVADIEAHGVREPVLTLDGLVLDGRNRYRACQRLGIDAPLREYDGATPLLHVISLNLHRRHLDESQRAVIAAKLANMNEGRPSGDAQDAISQSKAAEVMNVSRTSIGRARKVLKDAAPEVVAQVAAGKLTVAAAHEIADAPREEQVEAAKSGPSAVRKLAKKRRKEKAESKATPPAIERNNAPVATHERAEPKRRALYLWREFVALKVTPAEFVRVAGHTEAASLTRSVAKFFLEVGRLSAPMRAVRPVKAKAARKSTRKPIRRAPSKPARKVVTRRGAKHSATRVGA